MKNTVEQDWLRTKWRPLMAYVYMSVVLFDFIFGPIFWSVAQVLGAGTVAVQWTPLTLGSGGVFHAAMGAVIGITAHSRGQEKLEALRKSLATAPNDDDRDDVEKRVENT
jgi:hypothetical protein